MPTASAACPAPCNDLKLELLEPRRLFSAPAVVVVQSEPPPHVAAVYVSGTRWTQAFRDYVEDQPWGTELGVVPDRIVPWVNVDRVTVVFTGDVLVDQADLRLRGVTVPEYPVSSRTYAYDNELSVGTATWTLVRPLAADRLVLELEGDAPDGIREQLSGVFLDGDGDGRAGGDYRLSFDALPGDGGMNGRVDALDFRAVRARETVSISNPGSAPFAYSPYRDLNGDGRINAVDVAEVRKRIGTFLPYFPSTTATGDTTPSQRVRPMTRGLFSVAAILA
jgi:hypothetical protein